MRSQILYLAACSLVFAIITHISIIFFIPLFGEKDAAKRIMQKSGTNQFEMLTDNEKFGLTNSDPFFRLASCQFDLNNNAIEVTGGVSQLFWSASVFSSRGRVIYSLSQRTAIANKLRIIVVNPVQMANIRQLQPAELETSIVVETSEPNGFVIIRALLPDQTWNSAVEGFLAGLKCGPYVDAGVQ
ncbi:MAG: hypothetical protein AAF478_05145 [Pseudomonadota bacterium]